MSHRAWPARATSATQGPQTDTPRPSAPAPPVAADGWPAEAPASGPGTSQERQSRSRITARGAALAGDTAKAKKAFQDFFELWKDADPDLPILQQAKAEYAKLR